MLTREQILSRMRGFDCPKYLTESCWQPIYDQCVAAIDLATENERLKSKLDAVLAACNTTFVIQDPIKNKQIVESIRTILHRILEIIDKDGDET